MNISDSTPPVANLGANKAQTPANKKPQLASDASFKKDRSGLQVYVENYGGGPQANKGDVLSVHYEGWLAKDYKLFDSSRQKKRTFQLKLGEGQVIAGWEEALKGARAGTKLQLKVPAGLAYGKHGMAAAGIPPDSDLIFKVEVVSVKHPPHKKSKTHVA